MHNFKELDIWKESKDFCIIIYKLTLLFPKTEAFGLASQINRAVISIPSNIAEGSGRETNKDFSRFISIALGSAFELETQLIIANEINYFNKTTFDNLIKTLNVIQKKLVNFNKYLKNK
ncbi:MAG: four helix bundle protein [Flavobacteriales bacterium]|nr:four helix bundle protein [Flavobacteriales bacterium]NDK18011.1 four helix bundle protein [Flavobacteriales bacterium]